jgi:hypothetical protein
MRQDNRTAHEMKMKKGGEEEEEKEHKRQSMCVYV